MPNLNYVGSSGYGVLPSGRYGQMTTPAPPQILNPNTQTGPDYGVWRGGRVVSILTGNPWEGIEPRTGNYYRGGQQTAEAANIPYGSNTPINPNDVAARYKPVEVIKSPNVAAGAEDLYKTFTTNANNALKGFDEHLTDYTATNQAALKQANAATDIGPTVAGLTAAQRRYADQLNTNTVNYGNLNADAAARERAIIASEQQGLGQFNTVSNESRDLANQYAAGTVNRFGMTNYGGGGSAPGLSSDLINMSLQKSYEASLPYELAKVNKQYDVWGHALNTEGRIAEREGQRIGSYNPMAYGAEYGSATDLAKTIQQLKAQTAGLSFDAASRYLASLGVPDQIRQQILQGQIGALGGIGQLEEQSRYRSLQDILGARLDQPQYFSQATGPLPGPRERPPSNAPVEVSPTDPDLANADPALARQAREAGVSIADMARILNNRMFNGIGQPPTNYGPSATRPGSGYGYVRAGDDSGVGGYAPWLNLPEDTIYNPTTRTTDYQPVPNYYG